jgi:tyrosinase
VTRRVFALLVLVLLSTTAFAAAVKRRNWQCLTDTDKQKYIDAFQALKNRSAANDSWDHPFDNSLVWYQKLHNGPGGSSPARCIHGDERFLTWHRLMLWYFERALQNAANDQTLSLPYWNWTENPTGSHYPIEFENNPLLQSQPPRASTQEQKIRYTAKQLTDIIDTNPSWDLFAGGRGKLEAGPHNDMHGWVGGIGPMRRDVTAATDPLFWLFHNYIDALFDRWQRQYKYAPQPSCRTCPLGDDGFRDWTMAKVERTEDIGYEFDLTVCPAPMQMMAMAAPMLAAPAHKGGEPFVFDLPVPDASFRTAELRLVGVEMRPDVHYRASLFVFPADVKFAPNDARFRSHYLADRFTVWSLTHQHHADDDYYMNVTTELKYVSKTNSEGRWKGAVVIEEAVPAEPEITQAQANAEAKTVIIDGVSLVLDRGQENEP